MVFTWSWFRTNWNTSFPNEKIISFFYLRGCGIIIVLPGKPSVRREPYHFISSFINEGNFSLNYVWDPQILPIQGMWKWSRVEREKPWESNSFVCCIYWCITAKIPLYDCVIYDSLAREGFTEAGWIFYCVSKGKKIDFLSLQSDRSARKEFKKTAVTPSDFHPRS